MKLNLCLIALGTLLIPAFTSAQGLAADGPGAPTAEDFQESLFTEDLDSGTSTPDPLRPFNNAMFSFNDVVYTRVLGPVGRGYATVMPDPAEKGISNFFYNLGSPARAASALLQGKVKRSAQEVGAFALNSTVGIGGLLRPSEEVFEEIPSEDLGQTLGVWGVPSGPYLVLPLLGPSSLRDFAGDTADFFLDPVHYVDQWELQLGLRATENINALPERIQRYEELDRAAVDPYVALREAYLSFRERDVNQ